MLNIKRSNALLMFLQTCIQSSLSDLTMAVLFLVLYVPLRYSGKFFLSILCLPKKVMGEIHSHQKISGVGN